ncbi:hypothetical protein FBU30_000310 [Linnemannia zychae]|nr:hypothetical protein FBU30_000310 [Linnemannia zychae]
MDNQQSATAASTGSTHSRLETASGLRNRLTNNGPILSSHALIQGPNDTNGALTVEEDSSYGSSTAVLSSTLKDNSSSLGRSCPHGAAASESHGTTSVSVPSSITLDSEEEELTPTVCTRSTISEPVTAMALPSTTAASTSTPTTKLVDADIAGLDSESNSEFSCNICFDTSMSPVLTLCGHLFCWSCLHQWLEAQYQNPTCPVCKAGCAQDQVIPIYGRGKEQLDPRSTTPKRPAGQRPEPLRNPNQAGFALGTGQVTFSGTMLPPFMFTPFGIQYGATYSTTIGGNGAVQTPMQAYVSRMFFMLGTLILVGILLY